jgi:ELWxxDGT repeat protein
MFSHLKRQFPKSGNRRRKTTRQFHVEGLEPRAMLTLSAINFGATVESAPVAINGELFFAGQDATHGTQLWETNGTAAGTIRLTNSNDANGGLDPKNLTAVMFTG